jgi:pteridine reductase
MPEVSDKDSSSKKIDVNKIEAKKVALITGGAKRIGAELARHLHATDFNVVIHYRESAQAAQDLAASLNQRRPNSACIFQADLTKADQLQQLAHFAQAQWQRLDLLVNNASSFYPTPIDTATEDDWDNLMGSNLKAPFFLAQALAPELKKQRGCIINIADIYADRPLRQHSIYSIAKAGNLMLTKTLAQELAPEVRVNGIAPGAILWPEQEGKVNATDKNNLLQKIPLAELGQASDIAQTLIFLATQAPYISGQIISVDGGRSTSI